MATTVVTNRSQLVAAVAQPDAIVWIPEGVTIDMTGAFSVPIAPNVTIASNRNLSGKTGGGGLIKTTGYDNGIFINEQGGCRITGLRVKGPRTDYFDPWDTGEDTYDYAAQAFSLQGETAIVDNCEMFGWTFAAITVGSQNQETRGWIHHNSMHHNRMAHLGYPMDLYNGLHLIEWNYFDANRHSIAAFGYPTNGYEARFNVVGPHADHPHFFSFDMHSIGENIDSGPMSDSRIAGKFVNVHHNVFEQTDNAALSLSGVPTMYARFCQNWCAEREGTIDGEPGADLRVKQNVYGPKTIGQGRTWLKQLAARLAQSTTPFLTQPSPSGMKPTLSISKPPDLSGTTNPQGEFATPSTPASGGR